MHKGSSPCALLNLSSRWQKDEVESVSSHQSSSEVKMKELNISFVKYINF